MTTEDIRNGWQEYRRDITNRLGRLEAQLEELKEVVTKLRIEQAVQKTKIALWAAAGTGVSCGGVLAAWKLLSG